MNTALVANAASASSMKDRGFTFLEHDINGWAVAMICAVAAAVIYEAVMALARAVSLRIPFLVLRIARRRLPESLRQDLFESWEAELRYILKKRRSWFISSVSGTFYTAGLALVGARAAMRTHAEIEAETEARLERTGVSPEPEGFRPLTATEKRHVAQARRRRRRLAMGSAVVLALAGMNGPWLYRAADGLNSDQVVGFVSTALTVVAFVAQVLSYVRDGGRSR
ncbi:hypothetical protein [Streptomyces chartreusis]